MSRILELYSKRYFEWLRDLMCEGRYAEGISFDNLLAYLHSRPFRFTIPRDVNRAKDGEDLRRKFAIRVYPNHDHRPIMGELYGECSMLEMMVALSLRCEENIMDDPKLGNRSSQWFWGMIVSLGLGSMTDDSFDEDYVAGVVDRFIAREYEPNGEGGLFTIRNFKGDLRDVEIWYQLCWYLDSIV